MTAHRLPKGGAAAPVTLEQVYEVATRLNQLVLVESEMLSAMRIRDLHTIQPEKNKLSQTFDLYQRAIAADDQFVAGAAPEIRDRLYDVASELAANIEENMRLTAIAQSVNRSVMQTFVGVLADMQRATTYSEAGATDTSSSVTVSLAINERA